MGPARIRISDTGPGSRHPSREPRMRESSVIGHPGVLRRTDSRTAVADHAPFGSTDDMGSRTLGLLTREGMPLEKPVEWLTATIERARLM